MSKLRFVGLDVHAEMIAAAVSEGGRDGEVRSFGMIANQADSVRKLIGKLGPVNQLRVCYEAGPTGYVLYWKLAELGVARVVIAPGLIPTKAGDRVKTDRRDAEKLARNYRAGDLTSGAGIFKALRSTDPTPWGKERERQASAPNIVSMSPPSYFSAWFAVGMTIAAPPPAQIRASGITAHGSSLRFERRSEHQDKDGEFVAEESIDQRSAGVVPNLVSVADSRDVVRAASNDRSFLGIAKAWISFPARRDSGSIRPHPLQPRSNPRYWLVHLPAQFLLDRMEFRPHPL